MNHIQSLPDEDEAIDTEEDIHRHVDNHFKELFEFKRQHRIGLNPNIWEIHRTYIILKLISRRQKLRR